LGASAADRSAFFIAQHIRRTLEALVRAPEQSQSEPSRAGELASMSMP
jgi:hypothetical protein